MKGNLWERVLAREGRMIRFTNFVDDTAVEFERELDASTHTSPHFETPQPIEFGLLQRTVWLKHQKAPFRLLQIRDASGRAAAQMAFYVHRSGILGALFAYAASPALGVQCVSLEESFFAVRIAREIFQQEGGILRVRLQAYLRDRRNLYDFESRNRRAGYKVADPLNVTRTAYVDVTKSEQEILTGLDRSTQKKIKHEGHRGKVQITRLVDSKWAAQLQEALKESYERTGGTAPEYSFEAMFKVQEERPDLIFILGLCLKNNPKKLMAFRVCFRHGLALEAFCSGSRSDAELRSMPFNYFLIWEEILFAKENGIQLYDMGGITDGGPEDVLAGISNFKRQVSRHEMEIGREMDSILRPRTYALFKFLQAVRGAGF